MAIFFTELADGSSGYSVIELTAAIRDYLGFQSYKRFLNPLKNRCPSVCISLPSLAHLFSKMRKRSNFCFCLFCFGQ